MLEILKKYVVRGTLLIAVFSFAGVVSEAYGKGNKVTLCHASGWASKPFNLLEVSASAAPAHRKHGDVDPVAGVCPGKESDENPGSGGGTTGTGGGNTGGGTGTGGGTTGSGGGNTGSGGGTVGQGGQTNVTICHATMSATNPYVIETVAAASLTAHLAGGDVYPLNGACPGSIGGGSPAATPEPITMLLFGAGLAGVGYAVRRRKQKPE